VVLIPEPVRINAVAAPVPLVVKTIGARRVAAAEIAALGRAVAARFGCESAGPAVVDDMERLSVDDA
jgi:hypothetical protein